jgi:hypothetical protein
MPYLQRAMLMCVFVCMSVQSARTAPEPDAMSLFREEIVDAPLKLGWKGPKLDEDARFAVAVSGLSWQPVWDGVPLLRREKKKAFYAEASERYGAFQAALKAGRHKIAFPFALSVVLDPPADNAAAWRDAFDYLLRYGSDFDRALEGILQSPENLPLLPACHYAAADVLVWRASPMRLPFFMTLAESSDRYLRSRAVAALGIVAYRSRGEGKEQRAGVFVPLREYSISAVQQAMLAEIVKRAAEDKNWRARAAAALALGLMGRDDNVPALEKMTRDPAYLALPEGEKGTKRIVFPVRVQAAASLERFGRRVAVTDGVFSGKALKQAMRGGKDVTNDRGDIRPDQVSRVSFHAGRW